MKYTLHLKQNRTAPAGPVEVEDERILTNDVTFPHEHNSRNMRLWVIGNQFGPCGAVWAEHEQDALDELCDAGLAGGLAIEEADADEETARLGNAGEPHDLTYCWMAEVEFSATRDLGLMLKLAEARGACVENLSKI